MPFSIDVWLCLIENHRVSSRKVNSLFGVKPEGLSQHQARTGSAPAPRQCKRGICVLGVIIHLYSEVRYLKKDKRLQNKCNVDVQYLTVMTLSTSFFARWKVLTPRECSMRSEKRQMIITSSFIAGEKSTKEFLTINNVHIIFFFTIFPFMRG